MLVKAWSLRGLDMLNKNALMLGGVTVLMVTAASASAQNATLDEIVVTAQKKEESLQKVPIAITAISAKTLDRQGISDFQGISERTPGLLIGAFSPAQPEIAIRGVGTKEDGPGANDSTVVSVDDVYIASRIAQIIDIYDLERVEVLRGPQGTLYGRNSIAGSINFITQKPDEKFAFKVEQTIGSYNKFDTRALVKGAIDADSGLYGKLSYSHRVHDGFVDLFSNATTQIGELNGIDRHSMRGQLRYAPADSGIDAILTLEGEIDRDQGQNREPIGDTTANPARNSVTINTGLGRGDIHDSLSTEGFMDRDVFGASLKVDYDIGDVTLTSITAYRDAEVQFGLDCCGLNGLVYPRANYNYIDEEATQFTQELKLSGDTGALDWIVGVFYTDESDHKREGFGFGPITNPHGTFDEISASSAFTNTSDVNADIEAWAIYGQGTYALSDRMRGTLGLRYSAEDKTITASGAVTGGPPNGIIVGPFAPVTASDNWSSVDFRVALDYDLSDDVLLYGSVASGFKSGGFAGAPKNAASATRSFEEENALNYEVGLKSTLLENRLRLNIAAFYTDYKDLQVTRFALTPDTPTFGQFLTENAAGADIKGIEVESTFVPVENLELTFNYAYLDAEFSEFFGLTPAPNGTTPDFTGNTLRQAPMHSASWNANYTWPNVFSGDDSVSLNLSARYVDDVFYDPDNNSRAVVPSYTIGDVRLGYTAPSGKFKADVWVNNVTDKDYTTHAFSLTGGQRAYANVGKPRWYGVTFTYSID